MLQVGINDKADKKNKEEIFIECTFPCINLIGLHNKTRTQTITQDELVPNTEVTYIL